MTTTDLRHIWMCAGELIAVALPVPGKTSGEVWRDVVVDGDGTNRPLGTKVRRGSSATSWSASVVGKTYNGMGVLYRCTAYYNRWGFWMAPLDGGKPKNVSERAIGRTFHVVREQT